MDLNLRYLRKLSMQYKRGDTFPLEDLSFFLTQDGSRWFVQVSESPQLFRFSDHAIQLLGEGATVNNMQNIN
jgi:hypothetical protein